MFSSSPSYSKTHTYHSLDVLKQPVLFKDAHLSQFGCSQAACLIQRRTPITVWMFSSSPSYSKTHTYHSLDVFKQPVLFKDAHLSQFRFSSCLSYSKTHTYHRYKAHHHPKMSITPPVHKLTMTTQVKRTLPTKWHTHRTQLCKICDLWHQEHSPLSIKPCSIKLTYDHTGIQPATKWLAYDYNTKCITCYQHALLQSSPITKGRQPATNSPAYDYDIKLITYY